MKHAALKPKPGFASRSFVIFALCALPFLANARTWPAAVGEGSVSRWNDDKIAAYTLTIDDNNSQDLSYWLALGNHYAMDWTWFLITDNVGSAENGGTWAQWQSAVDQGHSIGSHSVTHYAAGAPLTPAEIDAEYADSQAALQNNLTANDALVLAYPYGNVPPNDAALAEQYYIAARGVVGGVNTGNSINYMDTHSISMSSSSIPLFVDPGAWMYYGHLLDPSHPYYEGWYSVHFHSVAGLENGVTNMLDALESDEADIWVGTFQQVAQYGRERENATLNIVSVSGTEIRFALTDTLDDTLFDFPLTVKIRVDSAWGAVSATQNGSSVPVELVENGGNKYALVKAVPDRGETVLQQGAASSGPGLFFVLGSVPRNQIWVDGDFTGPVSSGSYHTPYKTVQAGLDAAAPGMEVTVREGTYREQITLPSGTPGKPIALAAATGERVVLNAMVPLGGWQAEAGGLYSTMAGWSPSALYSGFSRMALAREPNEGWWQADSVSENISSNTFTITDTANLTGLPHDLAGASVFIWTQGTDRFFTCPVVSFDPMLGKVEFENTDPAMAPAAGDKYWLQNQLSLIDLPGEWASAPDGGDFRLHYFPEHAADLAGTQIPPASGRVVSGQNVAHVRLNDLEIAGGTDRGIHLLDVQDVEISRCIVHDNSLYGIWMRRAADCTVRNSVLVNNRFGLVCEESSNVRIEENEIGNNGEDGLVFARGSANVLVRRNHIHNHLLWGHPDNSQTFLGVDGIQYLENLIMAGGQSVMMEQTANAEFTGNMVIGSAANMFNFGHGTLTNVTVHGNTLACSGYSSLGMTGETAYGVQENIFMNGHGSQIYTVTDAMDYQGDRNLFWNGDRLVDPVLLVSDGAWGGGSPETFGIVYDCHSLAAGATSVSGTSSHADVAIDNLELPDTFPPSNWPNALTALQNNAAINSLASAISGGDYFTFTVTPDAQSVASYTNLHVRISLGANVQPATTVFTFMSSLTGFTASDALAAFTNETTTASTMGIVNNLDLGGIPALQNVTAGTAIEFRLYAHNIGANPMTRIGIGNAWGAAADDLRLSGSVSSGSGGGGTPETIYHTSLATFQSTVGQDLNSTNSDPLFVNAPFGINVMDSALLHQATRDTFALRDANEFLVGDHVEINFDGTVRTVTASSGATLTINPPLPEKPLKGCLIANWGTNTNFALDLGLQPGSPGIGMGQGGGTVGSPVSIQQFQNGDFDGDGQRDLPEIPVDMAQ